MNNSIFGNQKTGSIILCMRVIDHTEFLKILGKAFAKLILAGVIIGLLHAHDLLVALILALHLLRKFYLMFRKNGNKNYVLVLGMVLTGIFGVLAEKWGIYYGYWEYHDLSGSRTFPYWLPFAWMLSFYFIYDLELKLLKVIHIDLLKYKIIFALIIVAVFPTIGEMITIALGVWTYHWPYKIIGVPVYAIIALVVLHSFVQLLLVIYCNQKQIQDPIYTGLQKTKPAKHPEKKSQHQ